MSDAVHYRLHTPKQAHDAMVKAWCYAKAKLAAGSKRLVLEIRQETRTKSQNRHFHGLIGQISKQLGGDLADEKDAKRILISAFRIDTRNDSDLADEWAKVGDMRMGRGLRGEVVLLGAQSRDFSNKLASAFIDWLYAFGAEHDLDLRDAVPGQVDPETGEIAE